MDDRPFRHLKKVIVTLISHRARACACVWIGGGTVGGCGGGGVGGRGKESSVVTVYVITVAQHLPLSLAD